MIRGWLKKDNGKVAYENARDNASRKCARCGGLMLGENPDGIPQDRCTVCGALRYHQIPIGPLPSRDNAEPTSALFDMLASGLPDTVDFSRLLRLLRREDIDSWDRAKLRAALVRRGYKLAWQESPARKRIATRSGGPRRKAALSPNSEIAGDATSCR